MELFYSVFDKKNRAAPFFVWLKSIIERSRSILCLVKSRVSIEGRKEGRALTAERALVSSNFYGAFQLLILLETKRPKKLE
jgi:hypothetical protein